MAELDDGGLPKISAEVTRIAAGLDSLVPDLRRVIRGQVLSSIDPSEPPANWEGLRGVEKALRVTGELALGAADSISTAEGAVAPLELGEKGAYEIARHFIEANVGTGFTLAELKEYMRKQGVAVPEDGRTFSPVFMNWQQEIQAERQETGVNSTWLKGLGGNHQKYVLVDTGVRTNGKPKVAVAPRTPEYVEEVMATALELIGSWPDVPAHEIVTQIAGEKGLVLPEASVLINRWVEEGRVHRYYRKGRSYLSVQSA